MYDTYEVNLTLSVKYEGDSVFHAVCGEDMLETVDCKGMEAVEACASICGALWKYEAFSGLFPDEYALFTKWVCGCLEMYNVCEDLTVSDKAEYKDISLKLLLVRKGTKRRKYVIAVTNTHRVFITSLSILDTVSVTYDYASILPASFCGVVRYIGYICGIEIDPDTVNELVEVM